MLSVRRDAIVAMLRALGSMVRFTPKATEVLLCSEMTRWATPRHRECRSPKQKAASKAGRDMRSHPAEKIWGLVLLFDSGKMKRD
jgi:hypothetical protein